MQKAWLKETVPKSDAAWKLFASETMMMALDALPGQHANQDQWDGYSAEREEILELLPSADVKNLVVLSGDIHTFIAGNLTTTARSPGPRSGSSSSAARRPRSGCPRSSAFRRRRWRRFAKRRTRTPSTPTSSAAATAW